MIPHSLDERIVGLFLSAFTLMMLLEAGDYKVFTPLDKLCRLVSSDSGGCALYANTKIFLVFGMDIRGAHYTPGRTLRGELRYSR